LEISLLYIILYYRLAILAGLFAYSAQPITRGLISQIVDTDEQG